MAGLRERQKADRRRRILGASSTLFKQSGYHDVRIDAIAEHAEVSVGTFYNYFKTKGDLLLATVSMEVEEVLEQGNGIIADPPDDPAAALSALIDGYYDHSLVYLTKEMWRTAMALSIQEPDTPFSIRYRDLDRALSRQVCSLLRELQRRGAIRADADPAILGEMIFNNLNAMFAAFTMEEAMTLDQLKQDVRRQTQVMIGLLSAG